MKPENTFISLRIFISCLILFSCLFGCASTVVPRKDGELDSLLDVIRKQKEQRTESKTTKQASGIRKLKIDKVEGKSLVSVDLDEAWIATVLERIFTETGLPYSLDKSAVSGKISAVFSNLPVIEAIGVLLASTDASMSLEKNVIVITGSQDSAASADDTPVKGAAAEGTGKDIRRQVTREVLCYNTDVSRIIKAMNDFFPRDAKASLKFSSVPNANSILLTGKSDEVKLAADIIQKLDQEPKHVVIDASVIEVDLNALEELGIDIVDAATGEFSSISSHFGSLTDKALTFTWAKVTNPKTLTAAIDFLITKDKARLISRPYIATMSGEKATVTITNDRYVIVESGQDEATVSTNLSIPSGVILEIIPRVISDDSILIQIAVEDSVFVDPSKNVAVEVDKNKASTVMQVRSGEFIVIGGLILNRSAEKNSGFPYLRDIHGLNLLFGKSSDTKQKQETMILVRPQIRKPGSSSVITDQKSLILGE